jgi:hypothetical protein
MLNIDATGQYAEFYEVEAESRIRRLHAHDRSPAGGIAGGTATAREGISCKGCAESAQTRSQEENQGLRFPRPCRRLSWRRGDTVNSKFPYQALIDQTLPDNLRNHSTEPARVVYILPVIVAERLFVDIAEQMKGSTLM